MSLNGSRFDPLLNLSGFDGDSVDALRALHAYFANRLPECSLSLVQVTGFAPGQCRLAGQIGADGRERVANVDPLGEHSRARVFGDALTRTLFALTEVRVLTVVAELAATPFGRALANPGSVLGIPIANAGAVQHWFIFSSNQHDRFDEVDRDALLVEGNLAANLIIRPLVTRALRDETARQRLAIEGLADVQRMLLPDDPPIAGLDYAVHWQPADTAAGDYYDLVALTQRAPADFNADGADIWALMLADVSGHGAAAAMEAVQFDAILRTYQGDGEAGPAGALTYANRYFFSRRQRQHFLTAFALLYRPDLRRIAYVDAGHPPLLHRRGSTVIARGAGTQIPLGVLRDHVWHNDYFEVASGDMLVLHTDGVIEARDSAQRPFGNERLADLVGSGPDDPAALLALLRDELIAHQQSALGVDDQTLIVLRIVH
ncbi:MAG: SpoIIE family protein phosphatase [Dokdonella sp.]|uniref:PP2C family protein-serine/threonine phosphatase n=1 Tax=Dokdonella sp. TaxID=2291710 RepID=UPI0032679398